MKPATISEVIINNQDTREATVVVPDQLSLAIGKSGRNVRLAVKLTNWKLDIVSESDHKKLGHSTPLNEAVTLADKIKATSNAADDAENGDSLNDDANDQPQGDSTVVDEVQDESSDDANDQPQGDSTVVDEVQDESSDDANDQPQGDSTVVDEGQDASSDVANVQSDSTVVDEVQDESSDDANDSLSDEEAHQLISGASTQGADEMLVEES